MRYPFATIFEDNWQIIYQEYLQIQQQMMAWPERHLYNKGWEVFGLYDFPDGNELLDNCKLCPNTAALIKQAVPNHGTAGFSRLAPNTVISPHRGYQGPYLRMHLGLEIPDGDCGLRSGDMVYRWSPGKTFVFDDRQTHTAWNNTDHYRVALLIDFIP